MLRDTWAARIGLAPAPEEALSALASSSWIFDLTHPRNTAGIMTAHIMLVGRVCDLAASDSFAAMLPEQA